MLALDGRAFRLMGLWPPQHRVTTRFVTGRHRVACAATPPSLIRRSNCSWALMRADVLMHIVLRIQSGSLAELSAEHWQTTL
jgi:hypothetical protein